MTFIRTNLTAVIALACYSVWWLYLIFKFIIKGYDNNYAAVIAVDFFALLTGIVIVIFTLIFLYSAIMTKKWIKYLSFTVLLFVPVLMAYMLSV